MTRSVSRRLALASLVVCVIALGSAGPAAADQLFGFNEVNVGPSGQVSADRAGDLAKAAGADGSVITVNWRSVEPSPGVYRWAEYDELYAKSLARGIKPVFSLLYAPDWAITVDAICVADPRYCKFPPNPEHNANWTEFARRVAARYPNLAAIQVWNEPNLALFWAGGLNPERYTELLKLAHDAIKGENPAMPVLGGALANYWGADSTTAIADRRFLARMYAAGAKDYMDGISLHPYPADIDLWAFFKALTDIRTVRDLNGDSGKKLWVTEVGVSTTDYSNGNYIFNDADQAATLVRIYRNLQAMPDVAGSFIHTMFELPQYSIYSPEYGFGVMRPAPGLAPKSAYCALALARGTSFQCPEGTPANPGPTDPRQVARWDAQELIQAAADAARAYHAEHGSYNGLTSAVLNTIDPRLSSQGPDIISFPNVGADPTKIGVYLLDGAAAQSLLVCNLSKADKSYCIWGKPDGSWVQGNASGPIYLSSLSTMAGVSYWW